MTPNYRVATSLLIEYAWAVFEESPADPVTKELLDMARKRLKELAVDRGGAGESGTEAVPAVAGAPDDQPLFPGEVGDSLLESLVILNLPGVSSADSALAKKCEDKAKAMAEGLLETEEERVRGVTTLDNGACAKWIARGASVLSESQQSSQATSEQASAGDRSLRVGVLLPVSLARASGISDMLRAAVAEAAAMGPRDCLCGGDGVQNVGLLPAHRGRGAAQVA